VTGLTVVLLFTNLQEIKNNRKVINTFQYH
jgi:hypothetical protein